MADTKLEPIVLLLRDRYVALTARERLFLLAGLLAFLIFVAWWMIRADDAAPDVELAAAPPAGVPIAAPVQPVSSQVPAASPLVAPPPPPPSALPATGTAAAATPVLKGVMGRSAVFLLPGGEQRTVGIGGMVAPGLTLQSIGHSYAILTSPAGNLRIGLDRPGGLQLVSELPPPPIQRQ